MLKNKALENIEFIMQICYGINLIPNHANDIINIISRMNLAAITFLIQSMIYSACIKRDGLFRWTT